jgi:hypothetical protein
MDDIYLDRPNLYIGFHGCEKSDGMDLILHPNRIHLSSHDYEWLGHGFYVWENNLDRALDWACNHHPKYKEPFVIGIVYALEKCLDLTDKHFIELLSNDYPEFIRDLEKTDASVPQNSDLKGRPNPSGVLRFLDCFLIEHLHSLRDIAEDIPYFDTVRGAFTEGNPAYPGTQFGDKNHIQVCIRNKMCIKGLFLPRY